MNTWFKAKKSLIFLGILACSSVQAQNDSDTLTQIVSFDLKKQPAEASGREYEIGLKSNIISSALLPALPSNAIVVEVQFLFPSLKTIGNSFGSDVLFGFSGAVDAAYNYGDHAPEHAADFPFKCSYDNAGVSLSGGRVNLHYYDVVNDNAGVETIFKTGREVASLRIRYTVPKTETTEETNAISPVENKIEPASKPGASIYPNPSRGQVFISTTDEIAIATVYDMQGKVILENAVKNGEMIDISQVNPGIYTIRIASGNALNTTKIIKL